MGASLRELLMDMDGQTPSILEEAHAEARPDGHTQDITVRRSDGSAIPISISLNATTFDGASHTVIVLRDLTERRRLEAEVERQHKEIQAIYDNAPIMMALVDEAGTVRYTNPAFSAYVGATQKFCTGRRLGETLGCSHCHDSPDGCGFGADCGVCRLRGALRATLASESGRYEFEYQEALSRGGESRPVTLLGMAVRMGTTEEKLILLCLQDISTRKIVEESLRRSEERMGILLELATDGWWDWDLAENKLHCSMRWFEMLGFPADSEAPDSELWQSLPHPDDLDSVGARIQHALESGKPFYEFEVRLRHTNGHYVPVLSRARILRDADGTPVRICGFNLDLTEAKRREREQESLIQTSMDGFWVTNLEGQMVQVNAAICTMLRYTEQELLQMRIDTVEANESAEEVSRHIHRIMEHGHDFFESKLRRKDGTLIDVEVNASYLPELGPSIFVFVRDITERKAFETRLQASEARFRSYIEHAPIGVVVVDRTGKYVDANNAAGAQLGYSREELLKLKVADILAPSSRSAGLAHFDAVSQGGNHTLEALLIGKDGVSVPTEVHASQLSPNRFLGFHINLRERKTAETAMLHQAALDAVLAEISQAMVAEDHGKDMVIPILRHAMRLTGSIVGCLMAPGDRSTGVSIRRPGMKTLHLSSDETICDIDEDPDAPMLVALWEHLGALQAGCVTEFRCPEQSAEGNFAQRSCQALVLPILQHNVWYGQIVLADAPNGYSEADLLSLGRLAELYRLHLQAMEMKQELEISRQQFLQAQKMEAIGRLAGGVAHDFNNILGVIIGYSDFILRNRSCEGDFRDYMESVKKAALRGADLTRQLLAFARKQAVQPRLVELNESVASMLKLLGRLAGEQIKMRWHPLNRSLLIRIDPSQLDQLLANLIVNARDSMAGTGTATIETGCKVLDGELCGRQGWDCSPGPYAILEVSDTGCGMDAETLSRIFEPFFTTKPEGQGTGLGLATVHGIVHQNGGFVTVDSTLGSGTTFRIHLPLQDSGTENYTGSFDVQSVELTGTESILLVDDQGDFREACRTMLGCLGYTVITARDGQQAISLIEGDSDKFQLVITDLVMPGMNGRELWQELRVRCPKLRCVYMSGYTADVIGEQGVLDESIRFIDKPFSMSSLARLIREVLDTA